MGSLIQSSATPTLVEDNNPINFSMEKRNDTICKTTTTMSKSKEEHKKLHRAERKKEAKFRYKFKVESLRAEVTNLLEENEYLRKVIIDNLPSSVAQNIIKECSVPHPDVNVEDGQPTTTKSLEIIIEELALVDKDDMDVDQE